MFRRFCRFFLVAAALVAAPLAQAQLVIPGGGGGASVGGSSGQLQFNNAGVLGGGAGTAWDDTNRTLTISGATVTSSKPMLDLSQTWNAGAVAFTGLKFNATDTASASGSLLLDLQVGGASKASITKAGAGSLASLALPVGSAAAASVQIGATNTGIFGYAGQVAVTLGGTEYVNFQANTVWLKTNASVISMGASGDVNLARDAANQLAQRNGANANKFIVSSSWTDASNLTQAFIDAGKTSAGTLIIGSEHLGASGTALTKLQFNVDGTNQLDYGTTAPGRWTFGNGGFFSAIGRFQFINNYNDSSTVFQFTNGTANVIFAPAATTPLFQMGGTSNAFPAIKRNGAAINFRLADDSADAAITAASISTSSTTLHTTTVALTNGAAAAFGTLTNAPVAGNPTKWFPINDNGTTRYVPAW